ncbi:MAG: ribonuclease P protein component [Firmicutes bacterium]|nr:ribonuclease P protein component [Bacillota bacterium]
MIFTESLKKNYQFRFVYNKGRSIANKHLVMYVLKNNFEKNRIGISVSKKVGNSVVRSRVTRLIRESYRLTEEKLKNGFDIIVIARTSAKGMPYDDICASLKHLLKKHDLFREKIRQ